MKTFSRLLALLLTVSALTAWSGPAHAARLASVTGQAAGDEQRDESEFKLSEHSQVEVQFKIAKAEKGCSVTVLVHRKQSNGDWLVVNTTLRTNKSANGSRNLTLPAGDYKIEVIAKQARYDVSVDM
ncbi:MAG: hypothetical protein AAF085_10790 [Planctomycetota bacterium]